jgi:ADP-ribose pyrophosphatase
MQRMTSDLLPNGREVFRGARFQVRAVDLPARDGRTLRREVIVHPGAVVILPLLDDATAVLIRNERFAVGQTLWELPAGTLEINEDPGACAARELIEETGYRAASLRPLTSFFASPGIITERMHAFLAADLTPVGQDLDENERITVHALPLRETMEMVRRGEISDGKTIATLLFYWTFSAQR